MTNLIKHFDLTLVIPVTDWLGTELKVTIDSVRNYIESSPQEVDCLIVDIISKDKDIELALFQEIEKLPAYITQALETQHFRYIAEVDFTARALRKILLNCRGEKAIILGPGTRIGRSARRWPERKKALATLFPYVLHEASIMHWGLLRQICDKLSGLAALSIVSLVSASQIAFQKEDVISALKNKDQFSRDPNNFEEVLKECLVVSLLTKPSCIDIGSSTAITSNNHRHPGKPLEIEKLRDRLYSLEVNCSTECKIATDFVLDFTYKAYHKHEHIDWNYPCRHFKLPHDSSQQPSFSTVVQSIARTFNCEPSEKNKITKIVKDTIIGLGSIAKDKAAQDQDVKVTIISAAFRERQMIGDFLSNILGLDHFDIDHELILVLPERDISQGVLIDFYHFFHPRIRVFQLEDDPGIYNCWNLALEHARGEFITNANCDDRRSRQHIRAIVNALEDHQADIGSTAIVATKSIDFIINNDYSQDILDNHSQEIWYKHGPDELIEDMGLANFFIENEKGEVIQCYNFPHSMPVWRKRIHTDLGFFNEESHGTYSDFALWLKAARSGKKFIHINKTLGAYLVREDSHNRRNSAADKWLAIISEALPKKDITALSTHVRYNTSDNEEPMNIPFKNTLDFGSQITQSYGIHRAGWSWVLSHLEDLHSPDSSLYCDVFIEKKFAWGNDEGDAWHSTARPFQKPWIGFIHVPPHVPSFFQYEQSNQQIFRTRLFKESFGLCRALITLTNYHKGYLENVFRDTHIDIYSLKHPTEIPDQSKFFSMDRFEASKQSRVVQVGWWLRKLNAINYLELEAIGFKPIMLGNCDWNKAVISYSERRYHGLTKPISVEVIPFLENNDYDMIISSSVVFIDFYDTSANNAIIECIARRTPALVPRHPAIKEYLGADYPLYFSSLEEVASLLKDRSRINDASLYIGQQNIQELISLDKFRQSFQSIIDKVTH